jgi:orotate phosphoribosyltransferase
MKHPELAKILLERSYLVRTPPDEPFVLASGKTSWHYFDCDRTTSYAPAMPLIARAFWDLLLPGVSCVGGPTRGADPIADAIAYYSLSQGQPIHTFSVRKHEKTHGIAGWIEGSALPGDKVAFVDDVVTSGRSIIESIHRCWQSELQIVQVIVLVDREEQGGLKKIAAEVGPTIPVHPIFAYSELQELRSRQDDREPATGEHRDTAGSLPSGLR